MYKMRIMMIMKMIRIMIKSLFVILFFIKVLILIFLQKNYFHVMNNLIVKLL